jgi:hypothetical protein
MIQDQIPAADHLINSLEPLIRRIIREELERMAAKRPDMFYLEADMPIYQDMLEIRKRSQDKKLKFYSHKEVWGE